MIKANKLKNVIVSLFMDSKPAFSTLPTIKLPNGEQYAYREVSNTCNPKTLVLVHGSMFSSSVFLSLFPRFSDTFHIVAPDIRGHGQSSHNTPADSHDDHAEDLKLFFDALGLKKFYLLGWSMGGAICMKFTANYPEYVEKLILVSSMGVEGMPFMKVDDKGRSTSERGTTEEEFLKHPGSKFWANLVATKNRKQAKMCLGERMFSGRAKPTAERIELAIDDFLNCRCAYRIGYLSNKFNITKNDNPASKGTNEIAKIKCPVLLLHGQKDLAVSIKESVRTKELIGDNAELKTFDEGGHVLFDDYPDEFVDIVKKFCLP